MERVSGGFRRWLAWVAFALAACAAHPATPIPRVAGCAGDADCGAAGPGYCVRGTCQQCRDDADCGAGRACVASRCEARPLAQGDTGRVTVASAHSGGCFDQVYFAFDDAVLNAAATQTLQRVADCLQAERTTRYVLVGHCDPRGTTEYNLALGERRARAVANYLGMLGVDAARLAASSVGSEDATGTDDAGWTHDRRVDYTSRAPASSRARVGDR